MVLSQCAQAVWLLVKRRSLSCQPLSAEEVWFAEMMCSQGWLPTYIAKYLRKVRKWQRMIFDIKVRVGDLTDTDIEICRGLLRRGLSVDEIVNLLLGIENQAREDVSRVLHASKLNTELAQKEGERVKLLRLQRKVIRKEVGALNTQVTDWEIEMGLLLMQDAWSIDKLVQLLLQAPGRSLAAPTVRGVTSNNFERT